MEGIAERGPPRQEPTATVKEPPHGCSHAGARDGGAMCPDPRERGYQMNDDNLTHDGSVRVGGIDVTQELLERAVALITQTSYYEGEPLPEGYRPSLSALGPRVSGEAPTVEQLVYELLSRADMEGMVFRAAVTATPRQERDEPPQQPREGRTSPVATLIGAGFPRVVAAAAPGGRDSAPQKARAWADSYSGEGSPWMWVKGEEPECVRVLASAALGVWQAMEDKRARRAPIRYVSAYDLCGMVDSADQYGEDSRYNVLRQFAECGALFISDLGEEHASPRTFETFARLLAARHRAQLPTVAASWRGLQEWLAPYQRLDQQGAKAMGMRIVDGLSGYERDRDRARANLNAHVVDLARD